MRNRDRFAVAAIPHGHEQNNIAFRKHGLHALAACINLPWTRHPSIVQGRQLTLEGQLKLIIIIKLTETAVKRRKKKKKQEEGKKSQGSFFPSLTIINVYAAAQKKVQYSRNVQQLYHHVQEYEQTPAIAAAKWSYYLTRLILASYIHQPSMQNTSTTT